MAGPHTPFARLKGQAKTGGGGLAMERPVSSPRERGRSGALCEERDTSADDAEEQAALHEQVGGARGRGRGRLARGDGGGLGRDDDGRLGGRGGGGDPEGGVARVGRGAAGAGGVGHGVPGGAVGRRGDAGRRVAAGAVGDGRVARGDGDGLRHGRGGGGGALAGGGSGLGGDHGGAGGQDGEEAGGVHFCGVFGFECRVCVLGELSFNEICCEFPDFQSLLGWWYSAGCDVLMLLFENETRSDRGIVKKRDFESWFCLLFAGNRQDNERGASLRL